MSTRDIAYQIFEQLSEEQLKGFILMFRGELEEIPNEKTLSAIQETEDILSGKIKVKSYSSVEELFEDLEA